MSNRILDVVEALDTRRKMGDHFFVTALDTDGVGIFSNDNWHHLRSFCNTRDQLSFVIRRFEAERCPINSKLPMKTVCGVFATRDSIQLFSAEEMERAMNTDAATERPLPVQPASVLLMHATFFRCLIEIRPSQGTDMLVSESMGYRGLMYLTGKRSRVRHSKTGSNGVMRDRD